MSWANQLVNPSVRATSGKEDAVRDLFDPLAAREVSDDPTLGDGDPIVVIAVGIERRSGGSRQGVRPRLGRFRVAIAYSPVRLK